MRLDDLTSNTSESAPFDTIADNPSGHDFHRRSHHAITV